MADNRLILVFLSFAVALSLGHILRLPCKKFADFSVLEENSGLKSDAILRTLENTNRAECRTECLNNKRCKSFSTKESENSCELYSESSEDPKDDATVEERPGWMYHSTYYADPLAGPTCRRKNPCPGRRCMDSCVYPGYLCNENVYVQVATQQPCCTATVQTCCTTAQPATTAEPATTANTTEKATTTAAPAPGGIVKTTAAPSTAAPSTAKPSTVAPTSAKPSTVAPTSANAAFAIKPKTTRPPTTIRVKIVSQGYFSPNKPHGTVGQAYISVNGKDHAKRKRGYNVVVVDEKTGRVEQSEDFDTFKGMFTHARKKMKKFIESLSDGKVVLVAIQDEGSRKAEPEVYEALKMIHGTEPFQKVYRGAFAMIGYKGPRRPSWIVQVQPKDIKEDAVIQETLLV